MAAINVVLGPPVAGKSQFVKTHAKDGNVIVDYDLIAKALGSQVAHESTGSVRFVALESRQAAIERILRGLDDASWIIHTNPQPRMLQDYVDAGAKFVMLNPGKTEVLRRAKADGRPASTIEAIESWYANPPVIPEPNAQKAMLLTVREGGMTDLQIAFDRGFEVVKEYVDGELGRLADTVAELAALPPELSQQVASAVRMLHESPPIEQRHEAPRPPAKVTRIERDEDGNYVPIYDEAQS